MSRLGLQSLGADDAATASTRVSWGALMVEADSLYADALAGPSARGICARAVHGQLSKAAANAM